MYCKCIIPIIWPKAITIQRFLQFLKPPREATGPVLASAFNVSEGGVTVSKPQLRPGRIRRFPSTQMTFMLVAAFPHALLLKVLNQNVRHFYCTSEKSRGWSDLCFNHTSMFQAVMSRSFPGLLAGLHGQNENLKTASKKCIKWEHLLRWEGKQQDYIWRLWNQFSWFL